MSELKPEMALKQLQSEFFAQVLGQPSEVIEQIQSTPQWSASERMSIYSSGYRLRLKEAISTDFDRLFSYLGDDLFDQLLDAYIDKYRSHSTSLRYYSQHILELIESLEPFSNYPEIYEIAKIDLAFNFSFDAANGDPVGLEILSEIEADQWPHVRLKFQPAMQILNLTTNSMEIWKALSNEQSPPELLQEEATWIIWRKDLISQYRAIDKFEEKVIKRAMQGETFELLCACLINEIPESEIAQKIIAYVQLWIQEQTIDYLGVDYE